MKNSYRFFSNLECKYFPCHTIQDNSNFNCLFCYCPLYFLGEECGGNFKYSGEKKVKDCSDCHLPHIPEYYDTVLSRLKEARNKEQKKDSV
jgi:Zn-finger protein